LFSQIFYGVWYNVKNPKTKPPQIQQYSPATTKSSTISTTSHHQPSPTTTNPTKTNHRPPPATTNHHKPAKSHHKFNKKNNQTHHQPPQTHKNTINPQIITTYNHNQTHSTARSAAARSTMAAVSRCRWLRRPDADGSVVQIGYGCGV
jgi:hypothetical protein